jgi:phage terminase large subunit-like protein
MDDLQSEIREYIDGVLSGEIVACRYVKQACQRHLDDLRTGSARGLSFDEKAASMRIEFFQFLKHSKGEWAGKPIHLEPWQKFIMWCIFGWKREDGTRRFRVAYIEVARKNGKSTIAAGLGNLMFLIDGEAGAEVYTAATKRDQAKIVHSEAIRMVKGNPSLLKRVGVFRDNMHVEATNSKFEPLGADADTLDGLNIHAAIVDELHAHKTRDLWDVLLSAQGSRRQPLQMAITTAGFNKFGICYEIREYTEKILDSRVEDDAFFGIIFTIDSLEEWRDEAMWAKANPNLGISVKQEYLRDQAKLAAEMPSALNNFLTKHMNYWTQSETRWLADGVWESCGGEIDEADLRERVCYGGLDLSKSNDLTAWIKVFPPTDTDGQYLIKANFWIPEEGLRERVRRDKVPYDVWLQQGWIKATPGGVIDYDYIYRDIMKDQQNYRLTEIAYDPWSAAKLVSDLEEAGFTMVEFRQNFGHFSAPSFDIGNLLQQEKINHGGNPVLGWMAGNVVMATDDQGNIKPSKKKSTERIDGIVALIMAMDRALRNRDASSVYENRGCRSI